jgi:hypothetical protein
MIADTPRLRDRRGATLGRPDDPHGNDPSDMEMDRIMALREPWYRVEPAPDSLDNCSAIHYS